MGATFRQEYRGKFQLVVVLNGLQGQTRRVVVQKVAVEFPFISYLDFRDPIGKRRCVD